MLEPAAQPPSPDPSSLSLAQTESDAPGNVPVSGEQEPPEAARPNPVTIALIAVSVVVAIYSSVGTNQGNLLPFYISLSPLTDASDALPEVRQGEIWRLLTPMFIHFGLPHLIFNMLWLKDLGSAIERTEKSRYYLLLVMTLSLVANLGQYSVGGPFFGGMSGVVYGLFGYVWLRSLCDPESGYRMPIQSVALMLG